TRRGDHEAVVPALDAEPDVMEGAARRPVLDLRLRHRGLEVDVPHRRRLDAVDVPLLPQVAEAQLCEMPAAGVDRGVLLPPVDRQPDPAPQRLEDLLVLAREPEAQLDEIGPRHHPWRPLQLRRGWRLEPEAGNAGRLGVAAHVEMVLDAALR